MKLTTNNIWFTSDTHYNHKNICRGVSNWNPGNEELFLQVTRDFPDLETMNNAIVEGINDTVSPEDYLIHLGDWSFGGFEKIEEFRSKINCKNIILILGNHDHHIENNRSGIRKIFTHVTHYEELTVTSSIKDTMKFVLCHYPIISWNGLRTNTHMIHGHQHLKHSDRFGAGKRMDVGLCGSPNFMPYHIDEVVSLLETRESFEP